MSKRSNNVLLKLAQTPPPPAQAQNDPFSGVKKSFGAFSDSAGKFIDSFDDKTPGSTWNAFTDLYKGDGAPWAWGATAATALAMSNAFSNGGGGGGRGNGGSGAGNLLPLLLLGGLAYGAHRYWPKIKNLFALNENTKGWQAVKKNPQSRDAQQQAVETTVAHRLNPALAKQTADGMNTYATLTGNHGVKRGYYTQVNTSPDEYLTNNGIKAAWAAREGLGGAWGVINSYWRTNPNLRYALKRGEQMSDTRGELEAREAAQKAGLSNQDYESMKAAERSGLINGSYPVLNLSVSDKSNHGVGDQRYNREMGWLQDLRAKGSITPQAYNARKAEIESRQAERLNSSQAVAFAEAFNNSVDQHPMNLKGAVNVGMSATAGVSPEALQATSVINRPAQADYTGAREIRDGRILVRGADDPYWRTHKLQAPPATPRQDRPKAKSNAPEVRFEDWTNRSNYPQFGFKR